MKVPMMVHVLKTCCMTNAVSGKGKNLSPTFNKIMYAGLVLLAAYFALISRDLSTAMMNMGIALIFDPFNAAVPWTKRPSWQKAWLIVHLVVVFSLFIYLLIR
jgi:hypothetical protein